MRTSGRLVQLVPQSALPAVSSERARPLARSAGTRTAPHALRPRGLYLAATTFAAGAAEQTRDLRPVIPGQCRDATRGRPRSATSRRGDRVLQRLTHLESKTAASSARSLC